MDKLIEAIFASPIANLFVIAGLAFLGIAVVGNISGKIQPGPTGKIVSGLIGVALMVIGLIMYIPQPSNESSTPTSAPNP